MIITIIMNIVSILIIFGAWSFSNILTNLCRSRESTFHRGPAGQKAEEQSDVSDKPFSVKWNIPRERERQRNILSYLILSPPKLKLLSFHGIRFLWDVPNGEYLKGFDSQCTVLRDFNYTWEPWQMGLGLKENCISSFSSFRICSLIDRWNQTKIEYLNL